MTGLASAVPEAGPTRTDDHCVDWVPPTGCQFCFKLLSAFQQSVSASQYQSLLSPRVMLGSATDVLAADCPHVNWVKSAECMKDFDQDIPQEIWVNVGIDASTAFLELQNIDQRHTVFIPTTPLSLVRRDVPGHPGLARVVDSEWIDTELIRQWHATCAGDHGRKCMESAWAASLGEANPAYVVDTLQECIVLYAEMTRRYCTLSYTWGQALQLKATIATVLELMKPGSLSKGKHGALIPETICDAFAITRILGERYIWVDSLCIVQDDLATLSTQLSQMHLIYANSVVCIVAEAGYDASEGIKGITGASSPRQSAQVVYDIADGEKIVGSRLSLAEMGEKPVVDYHQRAWTFQEYLFARRRLVFGRAGMRWSCPSAGWREDLHAHPDIDKAGAIDHRLFLAGRWLRSPVPSLTNLSLLVWAFNEKWLSFPEDAIRAFSGIQSVLHRIYEGGLVYGLPELFFDISLAWIGSVTRRHASPSFAGERLQDRLPSWSWIGWHGRAQFPCDAELHMQYQQTELGEGFLEPVTQWYTMSTPTGPRRAIKSRWHLYKLNAGAHMEGWERVPSRPKDSSFPSQMRSTLPRAMPSSGYSTSLVTEYSASAPLPFWYPVPLPDWSKVVPELSEQTQYLYCRTTRAFMTAGARLVGPRSWEAYNAVALTDGCGVTVGVVFAASNEEAEALQASKGGPPLELVAVAKGWTVRIADASAYEAEVRELHQDKIDCYFVLWVEWHEGIAHRKAAGRVYVSAWDQVKEDNVELVFG